MSLPPRARIMRARSGEVAEWSNAPDSKSGLRLCRNVGSNPTLSAIDFVYQGQRLDGYRKSRPCGAILRFGVRTASRAHPTIARFPIEVSAREFRQVGAHHLYFALVKRLAPVSLRARRDFEFHASW